MQSTATRVVLRYRNEHHMANSSRDTHNIEDVERTQGVFGAGEAGAAHPVCFQ